MNPRRVLIIDDDPAMADGMRLRLQTAGYECRTEGDGEGGFAAAVEWRPHVILLDLRMPGRSGLETLADLRGHEETRTVPVVIVSGDRFDRDATLAAGADEFLAKPFERDELVQAVASVLRDDE